MRFLNFLVLLFLPAVVLAQPRAGGPQVPGLIQAEVTFRHEDLRIDQDGEYHRLRLRGTMLDRSPEHAGDPQLPMANRWFVLPPGYTVERVEITPTQRVILPGQIRPLPIQDPSAEDGQLPAEPDWDEELYPTQIGKLVSVGQKRMYRLAQVGFYPVEYRPGQQQLTLLRSARIRVFLRTMTASEIAASPRILRASAVDDPLHSVRNWIAEVAANAGDLNQFYPLYDNSQSEKSNGEASPEGGAFVSDWPSLEGLAVPYVIITNDRDQTGSSVGSMSSAFRVWADTLSAYGFTAVVKTVDEIDSQARYSAFDRPMRIRNFIEDAVTQWGTSYVLLGGDVNVVPTRRVGGDHAGWPWDRLDPKPTTGTA